MKTWDGKNYHSLDYEMKRRFNKKIYKLSLDAGMTCPNRDGTLGIGGCIFCSEGGSGDFATKIKECSGEEIKNAIKLVENKLGKGERGFIAYYQSYTNTYADPNTLRKIYTPAIMDPDIVAISIATRPDCLPGDVLDLLEEINKIKPVWVELGLQTIHEKSADYIRRGYSLKVYNQAIYELRKRGIECITHVILGLPTETKEMMMETVKYVASDDIQGIKLQLLHILRNTDLYKDYKIKSFHNFSLEEYVDFVIDCLAIIPEEIVIHRLTGDAPKKLLVEPKWSANKKAVLNLLTKRLKEREIHQGINY